MKQKKTDAEKKEARRAYDKKRYEENKERIKEEKRNYRKNNKERLSIYHKNYNSKNKDKIKNKNKKYNELNKEVIKEKQKIYVENNKDKIRIRRNNKRKTDILYYLKTKVSNAIRKSFKTKGFSKQSQSSIILGCSFEEFKQYLESKFEPWMTWDNRGLYNGQPNYGWDIDHIIPLNTAKTEEEVIRLNHYTNLQPLCSHINRNIKREKYGICNN